jgi:hypothetical protein
MNIITGKSLLYQTIVHWMHGCVEDVLYENIDDLRNELLEFLV